MGTSWKLNSNMHLRDASWYVNCHVQIFIQREYTLSEQRTVRRKGLIRYTTNGNFHGYSSDHPTLREYRSSPRCAAGRIKRKGVMSSGGCRHVRN